MMKGNDQNYFGVRSDHWIWEHILGGKKKSENEKEQDTKKSVKVIDIE